ncbi:MAG TPA: hypothetical protein VMD55_02325 [Terracidiphilus sp.]|nr:hypothetical protein [Terracidiphilus sp.]
MTILINRKKITERDATYIILDRGDLAGKIVRPWHQSMIKHRFSNEDDFVEAVDKNRKTLRPIARDKADGLFRSSNYLFSTKENDREETLYFEDGVGVTRRTGRLRQQHAKGPLAKIDKKPKTHRFLSKTRLESVKKRHDGNKHRLPFFYDSEKQPENGTYHIEFSCCGKRVSSWHLSGGRVEICRNDLDRRISSALKIILGMG